MKITDNELIRQEIIEELQGYERTIEGLEETIEQKDKQLEQKDKVIEQERKERVEKEKQLEQERKERAEKEKQELEVKEQGVLQLLQIQMSIGEIATILGVSEEFVLNVKLKNKI